MIKKRKGKKIVSNEKKKSQLDVVVHKKKEK